MNKIKKFIVLTLVSLICVQTALCVSAQGTNVYAANIAGGTCGDDVTWVLSEDGTMTIEGTGPMATVGFWNSPVWNDYDSQIKKVVIKKGVTTVQNKGFEGCSNLTKVTLPSTITSIEGGAFNGCTSLSSITIPKKVTNIGDNAFRNCKSLKKLELPNGLKRIGMQGFAGCGLTSVNVPPTITSLGGYSFEDCDNLVTAKVGIGKGSFGLEYRMFASCDNLTTVIIGNAVNGCENRDTFVDCHKLVNVTLGNEMESLYSSFRNCTALKEIKIPDSVTVLKRENWGYGVFQGCTALEKVIVGSGVTRIEENCFNGCTSLSNIYFCGDSPEFVGTTTMENVTATAHYPKNNGTWKAYNMTNHGTGSITWKKWTVPVEHFSPTIKNASNSSKGITVTWKKMTGAKGYCVYKKTNSGSWSKLKTTTASSWTDTNAKSTNTKYQYKVYAYDATSQSKPSGTLTTYYVATPKITDAKNNVSSGMTVKWKNNGSTGYKIQYSANSNFKGAKSTLANKSQSSKTIYKLTKNKTYYTRVRAYKTVSGKKFYSQWSSVKRTKISK